MANRPCLNPRLCGVQTHRPGTVARCAQTASPANLKGVMATPPRPATGAGSVSREGMTEIPDDAFVHTFDQIESEQASMLDGDYRNHKFALVPIRIDKVLDGEQEPIVISDDYLREMDIEEGLDGEDGEVAYMESLVQTVREQGDVFPPSVVIEREGHYEWIDGQHRMNALSRAGVEMAQAYVVRDW